MRICFLHVGPHKTATTTLQTCLRENADALAADGLYVPKHEPAGSKTLHYRFAVEMGHGTTIKSRDRIAAELRQAGLPERVVISSEHFSSWIRQPEMRNRLTTFFTGLGYEVKVIAYIRPQISAVNSYYTQRIKTIHLDLEFDRYFEIFLATPQYNHVWRFQSVLSDRNIQTCFVPFSADILRAGICQDFLMRLGVDPSNFPRYKFPNTKNASPGPKTIAAFMRVGEELARKEHKPPHNVQVLRASGLRRLTAMMGWDSIKFNGLTPDQRARLMAKFSADNEAFARQAWNCSWRDRFAGDEERALNEERNSFDPIKADPGERSQFLEFCRYAAEVMTQPVEAPEKDVPSELQPSISAADAAALRHRRAQRRQRLRTAASLPG